jgi:hypothetical protein
MMEQSASLALIFGVMVASGLLGAAVAVWFEFRNQ